MVLHPEVDRLGSENLYSLHIGFNAGHRAHDPGSHSSIDRPFRWGSVGPEQRADMTRVRVVSANAGARCGVTSKAQV